MAKGYTSVNEHTNAVMVSKPATKAYESGWEEIFKKPKSCPCCDNRVGKDEAVVYEGDWYHRVCLDYMFKEELDKA